MTIKLILMNINFLIHFFAFFLIRAFGPPLSFFSLLIFFFSLSIIFFYFLFFYGNLPPPDPPPFPSPRSSDLRPTGGNVCAVGLLLPESIKSGKIRPEK